MTRKEEIINRRSGYMYPDESNMLMDELISIYKFEYKPKHSAKTYLKIILDHDVTRIEKRHSQCKNYPEYPYCCFSVVSQHVYGFTKEHCLDQVYECVKRKEKRIKEYSKLPTLHELVNSSKKICPEKTYYTKEIGSRPDSCDGYGGECILEMREIGIEKYKERGMIDFLNNLNKTK